MSSQLGEQLASHLRRRPNTQAVVEYAGDGQRGALTWKELCLAAAGLAIRLRRLAQPDRAVIISSPNRVEYMVSFLAVMLADRAAFPVSPELTAKELHAAAERSSASVVIGDQSALDILTGHIPTRLALNEITQHDTDAATVETVMKGHRGRGSVLLQSSGTTGMPKIVRRSAQALDAVAVNCVAALGLNENDRMLTAIPLYHSYGIDHGVMAAMLAGCTVEMCQGFDLRVVTDAICLRRATIMPGVPFMFEMLAHSSMKSGALASLRHAYSAGTLLPKSVSRAFEQKTGLRIGQVYGTTEFGSVTYSDPHTQSYDPAGVGQPMGGVQIRIIDLDQPRIDQPLPNGEAGHVAVSAPSMLSQYIDDPGCPTEQGFLLSGDIGRLDLQGNLTIIGRVKLTVDVGGHKVNLMEVESVLAEHPSVSEAIVVPIPGTDSGCRLKAILVQEPGLQRIVDEDVRRFARDRLIQYKVPRQYEVVSSLPRSPTGKVLRQELACR